MEWIQGELASRYTGAEPKEGLPRTWQLPGVYGQMSVDQWWIYAPGKPGFGVVPDKPVREALQASAPADVTVNLTGTLPLYADASGGNTAGPSVLVEAMIGGLGALIILLFTFGTLPAVVLAVWLP